MERGDAEGGKRGGREGLRAPLPLEKDRDEESGEGRRREGGGARSGMKAGRGGRCLLQRPGVLEEVVVHGSAHGGEEADA